MGKLNDYFLFYVDQLSPDHQLYPVGDLFSRMSKEQYFAKKSAPPPPSPDSSPQPQNRMEEGEITDDFLMDIGDPFDNPAPLNPSIREGGGSCDERDDQEPPNPPQPNVDELLASLEATVNNNNDGANLPKIPADIPPPNNVPLQQIQPEQLVDPPAETPPTVDPQQSNKADPKIPENVPQDKENSTTSGKKRKPRKPRQQKNPRIKKPNGNEGAQRTMGRDPSGPLPDPSPTPPSAHPVPNTPAAGTRRSTPSRNRVWVAGGTSASPHAVQPPPPPLSSSAPSNLSGPATSAASSSSSSSNTTPSGYNRVPRTNPVVCLDVTSFKFIPEAPSQTQLVLDIIHGGRKSPAPPSTNGNMVEVHNYPTVFSTDVTGVPLEEAPGANPSWDEEHYITITDFPDAYPPERASLHSIQRRPSITFLLLCRQTGTRNRWEFPTIELAADFVNDSLCSMYNDDVPFSDAYDRSGRWGAIPTILLKLTSVPELEEFRRQLNKWSYKNLCWETYPRDVITMKADLSILLRNKMKSFQLEVLPKILFSRNRTRIAGSLRVLSHRNFPEGEKSHKGESKMNWRQVDLKGDEQLLRCLRFIPESSPFLLGVEAVQIRGGLRPQDPPTSDEDNRRAGKRSWPDPPLAPIPIILSPSSSSSSPSSSAQPRGGFPKRGRASGRGSRRGNRGARS